MDGISVDSKILQEIRKSHCSHANKETHNCAGSCKITPKGIELSCPICGDDKQDMVRYDKKFITRADRICRAIGLHFEDMTPEVQDRIIKEVMRDFCPNCHAVHILTNQYMRCSCGWTYSDFAGWRAETKIN